MKMVKTLLLGSAAGFVAIAGAQAADLPVKAKPVEYVKVCSVYGAGFYYIPGTDTCLKVGGFVRAEYNYNAGGSHGPYIAGGNARTTREDRNFYNTRTRGIITFDSRSQTEYGTLRAYIRAGWELNSSPVFAGADFSYRGPTYFDRAFIQFAGMTIGKTQSFFDFYANAFNYTTSVVGGSDTGHGINLAAYTIQFGGGFSGTLSLEDNIHRRTGLWDGGTNALTISAFPGLGAPNYGNYAAQRYPDIVANLRVDQPWGSAQVMGAIHDVSGSCYGVTCNNLAIVGDLIGFPDNRTGFAVGAGIMINTPFIGQGDAFYLQGTFASGAASYVGFNKFAGNDLFAMYNKQASVIPGVAGKAGLAWAFDGIFLNGGQTQLVDSYQINAAFQHFWTPTLRSSVFGGVAGQDYDASATAAFCGGLGGGLVPGAGLVGTFPPGSVCNPDFRVYQFGHRTIWNPVANLDIGVEVLYTRLDQRHVGFWNLGTSGSRQAGFYEAQDQNTWSGAFRVQRNFWP
jgi:hypothetical protein